MSEKIPILFLSDAVSASSGLARITRDLATRLHNQLGGVFEVASVGYGGSGSKHIPFKEYHVHSVENWLVPELPGVWEDFVGNRKGVLMSVWDMSRLYWLGMPASCPIPQLRTFAEDKNVVKWAYHAIDAEGPNGHLSNRIAQTMVGFDRVLDYSKFSTEVTGNSEFIPHGIDTKVWFPRDHSESKKKFAERGFVGLDDKTFLVGIVATNQNRKNWALGMQVAKELLDRGLNVRVWAHTDVLSRYWDIGNLIVDYGLVGRVAVTTNRFTDQELAEMYSACDVTLGIGPEGFGYPIAESLACGTPCFVGSYGAQAEFVPASMQIDPTGFYYEGAFCSKRPVHNPSRWANKIYNWHRYGGLRFDKFPSKIDWNGSELWPEWESWFLEGAAQCNLTKQGPSLVG